MSDQVAERGVLRIAGGDHLMFQCPGCHDVHCLPIGEGDGPRWGFNGNYERPTFTPSILARRGHYAQHWRGDGCYCTWEDKAEFPDLKCGICHSFVTDGRIEFLSDCTHELVGQTVDIQPWTEDAR